MLLALALLHATSPCEAKPKDVLSCEEAEIVGKVVDVEKGRMTVELEEAIEVGTHLAVIPASALEEHPELGQALVCEHGGGVTAVVEIDSVSGEEASGPIGRASAATAGDLVFVTDRETTHRKWWPVGPQAYGNIWDLVVRMYVLPDFFQRGVSLEGHASLSYQFSIPLRFQVMMAQLLYAFEDEHLVAVLPAFIVSYSSRYFELGFGVGMHHHSLDHRTGVSLFQTMRIGAENGLMARVHTVSKDLGDELWENGPEGLRLDSFFWEVRAPIHSRITFFLESWGGVLHSGGLRITGGMELMVKGTGGPGTIIVPIGAGGGFIERSTDDIEYYFYILSFILTTGITSGGDNLPDNIEAYATI